MLLEKPYFLIQEKPNNKSVVLQILTEKEFKTLDKEIEKIVNQFEANKFLDKWGINYTNILLYGDTKLPDDKENRKIVEDKLNYILPKFDIKEDKLDHFTGKSYKCWCCNEDIHGILLHPTVTSSWYCLMTKLKSPDYIIIHEIENSKLQENVRNTI